jgi:hypothetical protein
MVPDAPTMLCGEGAPLFFRRAADEAVLCAQRPRLWPRRRWRGPGHGVRGTGADNGRCSTRRSWRRTRRSSSCSWWARRRTHRACTHLAQAAPGVADLFDVAAASLHGTSCPPNRIVVHINDIRSTLRSAAKQLEVRPPPPQGSQPAADFACAGIERYRRWPQQEGRAAAGSGGAAPEDGQLPRVLRHAHRAGQGGSAMGARAR